MHSLPPAPLTPDLCHVQILPLDATATVRMSPPTGLSNKGNSKTGWISVATTVNQDEKIQAEFHYILLILLLFIQLLLLLAWFVKGT